MLLALDDFNFELKTLPYQSRQQSRAYRWAQQLPVASKPIYQYMGEGERRMTLTGVLYPEITGGALSLDDLCELASRGKPVQMVDVNGYMHGLWLIENVNETHTAFFKDGTAQKIEFDVALTFYDHSPNRFGESSVGVVNTAESTEVVA